jgi:hypothetical protein
LLDDRYFVVYSCFCHDRNIGIKRTSVKRSPRLMFIGQVADDRSVLCRHSGTLNRTGWPGTAGCKLWRELGAMSVDALTKVHRENAIALRRTRHRTGPRSLAAQGRTARFRPVPSRYYATSPPS